MLIKKRKKCLNLNFSIVKCRNKVLREMIWLTLMVRESKPLPYLSKYTLDLVPTTIWSSWTLPAYMTLHDWKLPHFSILLNWLGSSRKQKNVVRNMYKLTWKRLIFHNHPAIPSHRLPMQFSLVRDLDHYIPSYVLWWISWWLARYIFNIV